MRKLNKAQEIYSEKILKVSYDPEDADILSEQELRENLHEHGINDFDEADFQKLVE